MSNTQNYILRPEQSKVIVMSSDAYYYLLCGEEPLDDDNYSEINTLMREYPNGYELSDIISADNERGLITTKITPYDVNDMEYDLYLQLTKYISVQLAWVDAGRKAVRVWWYNNRSGAREYKGEFLIRTNEFGQEYFQTGDQSAQEFVSGRMSMYYIKEFSPRG